MDDDAACTGSGTLVDLHITTPAQWFCTGVIFTRIISF
ncbi:hypothetical protein CES85_4092 [Ochrobactrum quorumnocens]|uniref:Uncharacterized protein n=1 Tax=Ochrobactrum quorumnocens TaxID=271865 RepID=A0A248U962_9HYPH|nr:hypothetical protein CES85_4092 [[Ochrobactrum] quorumnocens]